MDAIGPVSFPRSIIERFAKCALGLFWPLQVLIAKAQPYWLYCTLLLGILVFETVRQIGCATGYFKKKAKEPQDRHVACGRLAALALFGSDLLIGIRNPVLALIFWMFLVVASGGVYLFPAFLAFWKEFIDGFRDPPPSGAP
jgi:hypothetical protein